MGDPQKRMVFAGYPQMSGILIRKKKYELVGVGAGGYGVPLHVPGYLHRVQPVLLALLPSLHRVDPVNIISRGRGA